MSRVRRYLDTDVLTAARQRIEHVLDTFDSVIVAFSGGKDSTVCLLLLHEVMAARGETGKAHALFRDEEVIPPDVIEYVAAFREREWLDLAWYAVPLVNAKYVLGQVTSYTTFDPERPVWVREPPEYAIRTIEGWPPEHRFTQHDADEAMTQHLPGRIAIITGVRASESLVRYRSVVNKMNEPAIVASPYRRARLVRPIYDWEEDDVFRYFYDTGEPYCHVYDHQAWAGDKMRVSTAMNPQAAKTFHRVRTMHPDYYDRIIAAFPDMAVQERYHREVDRVSLREMYASEAGMWEWITEHLGGDERQSRVASAELQSIIGRRRNAPESYPWEYVFQAFQSGHYRRVVPPCPDPDRYERSAVLAQGSQDADVLGVDGQQVAQGLRDARS